MLAALVGAAPAAAQPALDPPTVTVGLVHRAGVHLDVQAGPSGAPAGFTVEWMYQSTFDRLGGWPADVYYTPGVWWCTFDGTPTYNLSSGSYLLGPGGTVQVEMGDIFDETGLSANYYEELRSGQTIVLRVRAVGTPDASPSAYTPDLFVTTMSTPAENCTYTQGFWKNHPEAWPVGSLTLGTVNYTAAELLSILNTPAAGNGLLILAHQLIAAKLNIANGADPTPVASDIAAADAMIGGLVCPPVGAGYLTPASVNSLKDNLDDYNNGTLGVPHCGQVSAPPSTWGSIKATYR